MPKAKVKTIIIEAKGRVTSRDQDSARQMAENAIADMLRYDGGELTHLVFTGRTKTGHGWLYTARIEARSYTPARWSSFGIRTRDITRSGLTTDWTCRRCGRGNAQTAVSCWQCAGPIEAVGS